MTDESQVLSNDALQEGSELVSVGEFPEPMEAEMVKLRLNSAGIDTFLSGENAAILAPGLGPLEVQVRSEDEADAREIIADAGEGLPDEDLDEEDLDGEEGTDETLASSDEVERS
jgi:Ran GTPase-activating protein (RanGAP) involved in mRNA processing and transport